METRNLTTQEAEVGGPLMSLRPNRFSQQDLVPRWGNIINLGSTDQESVGRKVGIYGVGKEKLQPYFHQVLRLPSTVHDDTCIVFYGCFVCWFGCSFLETVSRRSGWPKILDLPASISQALELQVCSTRFSCIQSCLPAQFF